MRYHYAPHYFNEPPHPISVYLIGCGGTGSQVLTGLARINHSMQALGHPGLFVNAFDGDEVSETNIGRQLFSPADIGLNKADVLVTRINRYFGFGWDSNSRHFSNDILLNLSGANIIITCTDTARSRIEVGEALTRSKRDNNWRDENELYYWLDFGNSHKIGQVILGTLTEINQPKSKYSTAETLPTVLEQFPEIREIENEDEGPSCSIAQALGRQDLFINSALSQIGCAMLWQLLAGGRVTTRGAFLNLETMNVNPIKI